MNGFGDVALSREANWTYERARRLQKAWRLRSYTHGVYCSCNCTYLLWCLCSATRESSVLFNRRKELFWEGIGWSNWKCRHCERFRAHLLRKTSLLEAARISVQYSITLKFARAQALYHNRFRSFVSVSIRRIAAVAALFFSASCRKETLNLFATEWINYFFDLVIRLALEITNFID